MQASIRGDGAERPGGAVAAEESRVAFPPAREREGTLAPLNFRVPAASRREFKTYAARHDLKLNELLRRSFEAYRSTRGE